jgi:diaminohydroxyphosphoribosylaminopyrimidine deaminase/5-amino-6-(5-phosphoribosylamino)uracil reductase
MEGSAKVAGPVLWPDERDRPTLPAMAEHTMWMGRALQLARLGAGHTAPNPMVGSVLVQGDRILAEGWHRAHGGPHAEVECLRAFGDGPVPGDATMYVTLEPCAHHGLTPPCADLLIARGVKRVVVAHMDPFPEVAGRGVQRLRDAGVDVIVGVEEAEARWTNRRFLMSVEKGRPYIILKWARSADGFLDRHPRDGRGVQRISSPTTDVRVHQWRSEEHAIVVGSRTVVNDDPALTVRHVAGRSPLRVVLDRKAVTPAGSKVFNGEAPTLLVTTTQRSDLQVDQCLIGPDEDPIARILAELHRRRVRSVLIEGGATLLRHFIERGLWDEARVIHGAPVFGQGTPAPLLPHMPVRSITSGDDRIHFHIGPASAFRTTIPPSAWPW